MGLLPVLNVCIERSVSLHQKQYKSKVLHILVKTSKRFALNYLSLTVLIFHNCTHIFNNNVGSMLFFLPLAILIFTMFVSIQYSRSFENLGFKPKRVWFLPFKRAYEKGERKIVSLTVPSIQMYFITVFPCNPKNYSHISRHTFPNVLFQERTQYVI